MIEKEREHFHEVCDGMCERIFNGKDEITFNEYMAFRNSL